MNAVIANLKPLPAALQPPSAPHPARRHEVDHYRLDDKAFDRFNQLLARLQHAPLDPDQLASAARQLDPPRAHGRPPACIEQRLRRATTIGLMAADPAWQAADDAIAPAGLVMDYVRSERDLIPDELPRIGRLDDAIVIDAAWPRLAAEVQCYLDFCRIRRIEAELRGCDVSQFAFGRDDWQQARHAEADWIAHCHAADTRSYLPRAAAPLFRVR